MATKTRMQKELHGSEKDMAKKQWYQTTGQKLFDILSADKLLLTQYFDKTFYDDQNGPRTLRIEKQVNPEFVVKQKQQEQTES